MYACTNKCRGVRYTLPLHVYMLVAIINFLCQEIFLSFGCNFLAHSLASFSIPFHSFSPFYTRTIAISISVCEFFFLFLRSFCPFVCLFRCFSMCLHEGDKVFNPLHVERFRSLFSKSLASFGEQRAHFTLAPLFTWQCITILLHLWILFVYWRFFSLSLSTNGGKTVIGKTGFLILILRSLIITLYYRCCFSIRLEYARTR